jgi:hypothetical protein
VIAACKPPSSMILQSVHSSLPTSFSPLLPAKDCSSSSQMIRTAVYSDAVEIIAQRSTTQAATRHALHLPAGRASLIT